MSAQSRLSLEEIVSFCRRRSFVFQASEIYGGVNGLWDFGPNGVEMKRNIKEAWWQDVVGRHNPLVAPAGAPGTFEVVGIDSAIIQHPQVWRVSGHAELFTDYMVDCRESKRRYRFDHLSGRWLKQGDKAVFVAIAPDAEDQETFADERARKLLKLRGKVEIRWDSPVRGIEDVANLADVFAPHATEVGTLTEPREFNLMFQTQIGAVHDDSGKAYLRPETAQGIFTNFRNVVDTGRVALPLGIAQTGKSFRNEITPRHFIFRSREFEQMEMEFFCSPESSAGWYEFWKQRRLQWYKDLGLSAERLRLREHAADELSHYSLGTSDIEYAYPFMPEGEFGELEGIANRGNFDLTSHSMGLLEKVDPPTLALGADGKPRFAGSGKNMNYTDVQKGQKYIPHVIEPAAGVDRAFLAFLSDALEIEAIDGDPNNTRAVLRLHPRLAPVKAAVFPLVKKDGMPEVAKDLFGVLKAKANVSYDEKDSIGRRYRRADEIGVPICITVDNDTLADKCVTIRNRDTLEQERVRIEDCEGYLAKLLG